MASRPQEKQLLCYSKHTPPEREGGLATILQDEDFRWLCFSLLRGVYFLSRKETIFRKVLATMSDANAGGQCQALSLPLPDRALAGLLGAGPASH